MSEVNAYFDTYGLHFLPTGITLLNLQSLIIFVNWYNLETEKTGYAVPDMQNNLIFIPTK